MHQNEIEGALIFVKFFDRIFVKEADDSGIVEECQIHLDSVVGNFSSRIKIALKLTSDRGHP